MRLLAPAVVAALAACAPHAGPPSHEPPPPTPVTAARAAPPAIPSTILPGASAPAAIAPRDSVAQAQDVHAPAAPAAPAASATPAGSPRLPPAGPDRGCIDDGAPYDPAALRAQIAYLASSELDGRATGTAGDLAARRHVAERFRCLGLVPAGEGGYEQPFTADGQPTANLVGYLPGDDAAVGGDIIVVGAHHDHLGAGHLGANDDASGTAALLAIAQAVRQHGAPRRTIAFVAFGGEELGLVGSTYFAAHPPAHLPLDRVVYDINLDMIGSYAEAGAVYAMGTFRGLAATRIVKALAAAHPALHVGVGGRGVGSDHEAFCHAGVPYVFFWTPDRRCYHARCDTIDQLDAGHAGEIAALAGALVEQLASSTTDLAGARARLGCTGR
ncbi:MAG TPA: M28 family peptidase [Kofleriaceae bacterium]|nr:M28 family peptidase [Kofleriaceae bacterium]